MKRTGGELIVEALKANGVKRISCVPGESYLAVLEGLWLWTKDEVYFALFNFWKTIFALAFGMGVVSGIVMSYQFGTNWAVFSDKAGPIIGPLMAYEVLTAFFLEAGFLGVMLFGMNRVGKKLHFTATLMVALGTFVSAFWILSVNSWMQTPAGYAINANGQFISAGSWLAIIWARRSASTGSSHCFGTRARISATTNSRIGLAPSSGEVAICSTEAKAPCACGESQTFRKALATLPPSSDASASAILASSRTGLTPPATTLAMNRSGLPSK